MADVIRRIECNRSYRKIDIERDYRSGRINFAFFPAEVLLKIFSYIDFFTQKYTLSLVCKNWATVSSDPLLNRAFKVTGTDLSTRKIKEMLADTPTLASLSIVERPDSHKILKMLRKLSKNLKSLKIDKCHGSYDTKRLSPSVLINSVKRCSYLERLIIKDTFIDDYGRCLMYTIGFVLPNLRKLTLVNISTNMREEEAIIIVRCCNKLEDIKIFQMQGTQLTDRFVETTCDHSKSRLKILKVNAPLLTSKSITFLKTCENLTKLHLKYSLRLDDLGVNTIADCLNLTSLDLTMALSVSTDAWIYLFNKSWMKNIEKIVLGQCDTVNNNVLQAIGQTCSSLLYLGLAGCVNINENGLFYIVFGCRKITCLDLFYTPTRLLKCFLMFPQNLRNLRKLTYRSSGGFKGNQHLLGQLQFFLPDLEIYDTVEKLK